MKEKRLSVPHIKYILLSSGVGGIVAIIIFLSEIVAKCNCFLMRFFNFDPIKFGDSEDDDYVTLSRRKDSTASASKVLLEI